MRQLILAGLLLVLTASCGTPRLYYWGSTGSGTTRYENLTYQQYDKQSPESVCALVCLYEEMVTHPGGARQTPPPGICAEYGFLLLQPTTADYFAQHATQRQRNSFESSDYGTFFAERGKEMLAKEIELYPESAQFITPLLNRMKGGSR